MEDLVARGTIASAVISFCLLLLTALQVYVGYKDKTEAQAALQVANAAKAQSQAGLSAIEKADTKLKELVTSAEAMAHRVNAVESVLTQVDLATGGRKLCQIFENPTWGTIGEGPTALYVPSSWTAAACKNQAVKLKATRFKLGCIFDNRASLGAFVEVSRQLPAAIPPENCGW